MTKRKGTSIDRYELENGEKRYMFQIYVGVNPLTGKEERTTRRGFKTEGQAKNKLAEIRIEIDVGEIPENELGGI